MKARLSVLGFVVLVSVPASALGQAAYEIVSSFENRPSPEGEQPYARLVQATDGSFYGVTSAGSAGGAGTVFKIDAAGTLTTVHRFNGNDGAAPRGGLIQATDGRLYGTTSSGGASGQGTVFRTDGNGALETLHNFSGIDGATPLAGLVEAADGRFYGTTSKGGAGNVGTVFVIDAAGVLLTLHSFAGTGVDGANPEWPLSQGPDGLLYGTIRYGAGWSAAFKIDGNGVFTMLFRFGLGPPASGLTLANDGTFYGTTSDQGQGPYGRVYRMDASGAVTWLHSFTGTDGANPYGGVIQAADGNFYGTTFGSNLAPFATVFKMDATGALTTLHRLTNEEGAGPWSGVIQGIDGSFYGTARFGGDGVGGAGHGTVFKVDATGTLTSLHRFKGPVSEGFRPNAIIEGADGRFYGTTDFGGAGYGSVFSLDVNGTRTLLHTFSRESGHPADSGLIQAASGTLWGTTTSGDSSNFGTVFRMDPAGPLATVHAFNGADGSPAAGITQARDGNFYGTTDTTGAAGTSPGTIFRVDANGAFKTLQTFDPSHGLGPSGGLVEGSDGKLYGTTNSGGAAGLGTVFAFDLAGALATVHDFDSSNGFFRKNGVIEARDGAFYGTTSSGGTFDRGTVFRMDASGTLTTLHSFNESDGAGPLTRLLQGHDGRFYGTTRNGGAFGAGTVFSIDGAGTLLTLHHFSPADGAYPTSTLIQTGDGHLHGATEAGGPGDGGVVFRLRLPLNGPPLAVDDTYRVTANTTLTRVAPGVLGNDTEPDGDPLAATLVEGAAHGDVILNADGSFSYSPEADFCGQDSFRYSADDGRGLSTIATVFITVDPPAGGPVLTLSTTVLTFSPQPIRHPSAPQIVVVTNTGTDTLHITEIAVVGSARRDFVQTGSCAQPIASGRHCTVRVRFVPQREGVRRALLVLHHDASIEPSRVRLIGTGIKVKGKP